MTTNTSLVITGLAKRYGEAAVFQSVDLHVAPGEFVAIVGESGVGKSSLLNCMAALDTWSEGRITHDGVDLGQLSEAQAAHWRREHLGFVFQAPDGHPKLLHLWPVKLLQAGQPDYDASELLTIRAAASWRR